MSRQIFLRALAGAAAGFAAGALFLTSSFSAMNRMPPGFVQLRFRGGGRGRGRLLGRADGLPAAPAGAGVGLGALAADRQVPAVPEAAVGPDLDEAPDVPLHLALQI